MATQRFNPLTNANKLKSLGLDNGIAEEIAQQQAALLNSELATKDDLSAVKTELKVEMSGIRLAISELESRLIKYGIGLLIGLGIIQHFIGGK